MKRKTGWGQKTFAVADSHRAAAAVRQPANLIPTWRVEKASTCLSLDLKGNQVPDSSSSQEHWMIFESGGKVEGDLAFSCCLLSKQEQFNQVNEKI